MLLKRRLIFYLGGEECTPIFALPNQKNGYELVAQLVEQYTFNVWALGSSPSQFTSWDKSEILPLVPFFFVAQGIVDHEISTIASFTLPVRY